MQKMSENNPDSNNAPADEPQSAAKDPTETSYKASGPRNKAKIVVIISLVGIILLCILGGIIGSQLFSAFENNNPLTNREGVKNDGNRIVTQEEENIAGLVNKVSPSVVSIVTTSQGESFYGPTVESGAGTGIIVGKDGYVMTNKHVVKGTSEVSVVLTDGTTYENVRVIGSDPLNDVAFLKINGVSDLPAAELGDSGSIRVGQKVVAIGNSLGQYQNTVTSGIISGTGRPISAQDGETVENLNDLIQTDAAINPGNSGGPLLNLAGQVIGINTAIIEDAQGIGFAIPVNTTKGLLKGVLAGKGVERSYLGINYIPITADVVKRFNLKVKQGAYVRSGEGQSPIVSGSPAEKAGVKEGDIITKVSGVELGASAGLSSLVAEYAPGDTVELTIVRDGREMTLRVTLAKYTG
ncbi:MAG TPA: trypsin-like peptidase domain-containing protein [Candidatus Saccharimonadales bacterium]